MPNRTPTQELTTETYLGYDRFDSNATSDRRWSQRGRPRYHLPSSLPADGSSFGGQWTVQND